MSEISKRQAGPGNLVRGRRVTPSDQSSQSTVAAHLSAMVSRLGPPAWLLLGLMVTGGIVQGAGIMLLIPLLQTIGVGAGPEAIGGIGARLRDALSMVGVPMTLPVVLGGFVLVITTQALLMYGQATLDATLVQRYARSFQNELFRSVSFADWALLVRRRGSDFVHLMISDVARIGMAAHQSFRLASDLVVSGVYLLTSLIISVPLTVVAAGCGLILLALLQPQNRRSIRSGERSRLAVEALQAQAGEQLSSLKLAKAFGREMTAVQRFERTTGQAADEQVYFARVRSFVQLCHQVGGAVALALIVFVAARWMSLSAAEYLVLAVVFARLLPRLSSLQQTWQSVRHNLPSFAAARRALRDLSDAHEHLETAPMPVAVQGAIELQGVEFRYAPELEPVLKGVDLTIPAKRLTAVLGASGAGKSTLADVLLGLVVPDRGRVVVDGRALDREWLPRWRRSVGYVPQESFLFHDTLRANLLWAKPDATEDELWQALRLAAADEFVSELADGLDSVVGDRGGRISGGERQRIALARALLLRPSFLLMDEATSQVDVVSQARILEAVARLRGQMTVVIIAHHAPVEAIADQVVVLDQGRCTERGQGITAGG